MAKLRGAKWVLLIACCGCRSVSTARIDHPAQREVQPSAVATRPAQAAEDDPQVIELTAAESPVADSERREPTHSSTAMSLSQCIATGLTQNPDLIALRETENVSSAALGVAETYPFNPFVQVQATPYQDAIARGPGTTYHYVLLMQTIQLAHQQQFREEGAVSALNSTRWNLHQAELVQVAQTERLYFSALYLRDVFEVAQANDQNNQQLLRILEKQLNAGQATAADVAIVRVDANSTRQQARLAKANYATALRDLKRQIGVPSDIELQVDGSLRSLKWKALGESDPFARRGSPDPAETPDRRCPLLLESDSDAPDQTSPPNLGISPRNLSLASRVAARPDVMAAHSDIDVARAGMCLATAAKTPDLQIGPYYQRTADGTSFLGFRAQMDIPVPNTGRPLEQQRVAEFNQRVIAWHQLQRRAELEAQAAWERYELAREALADGLEAGSSDVPHELEKLEQQFQAGEVDVVRVIQARASIIQNQRAQLDLLNEVAQAAANLTVAAAVAVEELMEDGQN